MALHGQLGGGALLPIHHATFDLALHDWDQPIVRVQQLAEQAGIELLAPRPGATVQPGEPGIDPFWIERRRAAERGGQEP